MIAVLADDLTSALDGAAPFAQQGLSAQVLLQAQGLCFHSSDVVAIDLDSRFATPPEAERSFAHAAEQVSGARLLYKTVDSTLRGNLAAELRGTLNGSGRSRAVVAPAFPARGRTTVGGHQFVAGVPLERTSFAHDPRTPVPSGRVIDRFSGLDDALFSIHDAAHDQALDELVASIGLDEPVVWVGSPGLGAALARAVPMKTRSGWKRRAATRVLAVIGSLHPANGPQIERLVGAGAAIVRVETIGKSLDPGTVADQIARAFINTAVVCLLTPSGLAAGGPTISAHIADRIGTVVERCAAHFDGLVATGGDTARRIVDALSASALDLEGEVEPGVPIGVLRTPVRDLPFITKAGGFGDAETLLRCVDRLRAAQEPRIS